MQVSEIKLFQILKEKIGEVEAQALVEYVEGKVESQFESKKDILATKQDLFLIKQEIADFKVEIIDRIGKTNKTIYIVGLVQFLAIIASILGIFSFMMK